MNSINYRGHRYYFHKNPIDEKLTLEFKRRHREELQKLMSEWLKNNVIKRPKIEWRKFNYGNKKVK